MIDVEDLKVSESEPDMIEAIKNPHVIRCHVIRILEVLATAPAESLSSKQCRTLLARCQAHRDMIFLDNPAVNEVEEHDEF